MSLHDILVKNSPYEGGSSALKSRLYRAGLLKEDAQCAECGVSSIWNGKRLVLQLDHINGSNRDNRIENLRLLCPNCHSQTDTYAGRNVRTNRNK